MSLRCEELELTEAPPQNKAKTETTTAQSNTHLYPTPNDYINAEDIENGPRRVTINNVMAATDQNM